MPDTTMYLSTHSIKCPEGMRMRSICSMNLWMVLLVICGSSARSMPRCSPSLPYFCLSMTERYCGSKNTRGTLAADIALSIFKPSIFCRASNFNPSGILKSGCCRCRPLENTVLGFLATASTICSKVSCSGSMICVWRGDISAYSHSITHRRDRGQNMRQPNRYGLSARERTIGKRATRCFHAHRVNE